MFEKVSPSHPDKLADRIAGAIVDLAYSLQKDPKIAVEVLLGHGVCNIIAESSVSIPKDKVGQIVYRISGIQTLNYIEVPQDTHLADNQKDGLRCGDNGIFKGTQTTSEQYLLSRVARDIYKRFPSDGKYILDMKREKMIVCHSNAKEEEIRPLLPLSYMVSAKINPLGEWTGGTDVDSGATNRKLGSDMGDAVTGGGLHGKDLSKADVSVNIYAHLMAEEHGSPVEICCAIGDKTVDGRPYEEIVQIARNYIQIIGGFEKFAEWGLI